MLDAFASVGAERFDLTCTDAAGGKATFRGNRSLDQLRPALPAILQEAGERQHNVIVRPRSGGAALIQLDDLGEVAVEVLRPVSFLVLRTSPGNYQAWVAVSDGNADFARRLRKGTGADLTASGATRVSGSLNFKEKYAPAFPRIETVHASPGLVVTQAKLEALGAVAPPERADPAPVRIPRRQPGAKGWPSYQRCVEMRRRPAKADGLTSAGRISHSACWHWIGAGASRKPLPALCGKAARPRRTGKRMPCARSRKPPPRSSGARDGSGDRPAAPVEAETAAPAGTGSRATMWPGCPRRRPDHDPSSSSPGRNPITLA